MTTGRRYIHILGHVPGFVLRMLGLGLLPAEAVVFQDVMILLRLSRRSSDHDRVILVWALSPISR